MITFRRATTISTTSWWAKSLPYLLVVVLAGCNKPEDPSLKIKRPGDDKSLIFTDTVALDLETVLAIDSFPTWTSPHLLAGRFDYGDIGTVENSCATELLSIGTPAFRNFGIPALAEFDSMTCSLQYSYVFGDTSMPLTYHVHRLTSRMPLNASNVQQVAFDPSPLFSFTFTPAARGGATTSRCDELGRQILALQPGAFTAPDTFAGSLRGLIIVPDVSVTGTVVGFDVNAGFFGRETFFRLYHKRSPGSDSTVSETFLINFISRRYNRITPNRAGSTLSALTMPYTSLPSNATGDKVFLQNGTGVRIRMRFPYLLAMREALGGMVIAKAELVLKPDSVPRITEPNVGLVLGYELQENGQIRIGVNGDRQVIPNEALTSTQFSSYSSSRNEIRFPITLVAQRILNGSTANNGIILGTSVADDGSRINISRFRSNQIKLELYYLRTGDL